MEQYNELSYTDHPAPTLTTSRAISAPTHLACPHPIVFLNKFLFFLCMCTSWTTGFFSLDPPGGCQRAVKLSNIHLANVQNFGCHINVIFS